jgi:hypothetical protein
MKWKAFGANVDLGESVEMRAPQSVALSTEVVRPGRSQLHSPL